MFIDQQNNDSTSAGDQIQEMVTPFDEKIILLCTMLMATLIFALLPFKLLEKTRQNSKWKTAVSLASCFSGGVFIGACILDLFPDVHEAFDQVLEEIENDYGTKIDFPVAGFAICIGFFMVLALEQFVLTWKESWSTSTINATTNGNGNTPLIHDQDHLHEDHQIDQGSDGSHTAVIPGAHHHHHEHDHLEGVLQHSTMRSYLLLIALSFHSVFEGMAIGLQHDLGALVDLFVAVIAHKAVMAFSLGLNLAQARLKFLRFAISVMIFSLASPIGMIIGMALSNMKHTLTGDVVNSALQGITGGTFLYVTFFEVLPHELNQRGNRIMKLIFVLVGFLFMCGLMFITH